MLYFQSESGDEFLARVFLIEPSLVEYKTRTKSASKRKPNLTYEELLAMADENGVGDMYRRFLAGLDKYFTRTRQQVPFASQLISTEAEKLYSVCSRQRAIPKTACTFKSIFSDFKNSSILTKRRQWHCYPTGNPNGNTMKQPAPIIQALQASSPKCRK